MGISMLSALVIRTRGDDVKCEAGGPDKEDKWAAYISLYRNNEFDHFIISTEPYYESKEKAIEAMEAVVKEIREMPEEKFAIH